MTSHDNDHVRRGFRPAWMECRHVNATLASLPVADPTAVAGSHTSALTPTIASFLPPLLRLQPSTRFAPPAINPLADAANVSKITPSDAPSESEA